MKKQTYNKFVDYYDDIIRWNWYDLVSEINFLNDMIHEFSPLLTREGQRGGEILEFACWTWTIARELTKKWYSVTWVDLSEQMIDRAKNIGHPQGDAPTERTCRDTPCGYPDMNFSIWDMTSVHLNKEFDIILCNYNSVCHLHSWEDWKKFFKNAYKHLKKWGIFIFDILTLFEFENISRDFKWFFNVRWDSICLEMFKKSLPLDLRGDKVNWFEKTREGALGHAWKAEGIITYNWLIKMFVNRWESNFELIEEEIREISFPLEQITKSLKDIWFTLEHIEDFHFGEVTPESERVYFIASK